MAEDFAQVVVVGVFTAGVLSGYSLRYYQSRVLLRQLESAKMLLEVHGVHLD
ncbi:hypothetical protein [Bradyrhizobium sp. BR13661]|jgi:hypothetical protein|uniref:hypothetical protein n=1 Tax=Bradyrhizobium sp. BR13661 TaxID=2940622 RepID=UPI002474FFAC|nr:hypothetical protein [Bradyrhizobium sp. BR13661]MDH6259139.1 hypothetical protein [Bradyrhizobium sp. BR13661]